MSLAPGQRLGVYEVVAPLGKGGMGEVFRGRDTKLGREVAIKILPPAMARETSEFSDCAGCIRSRSKSGLI